MITHATGNLLRADAEALVNTVNTVGVMGKGIALQFKKAFPEMFEAYRRAAKAGEIRLGHVHVWPTGQMTGPRYIINFPTKGHWKARSKLDDIVTGLDDLVEVVRRLEIGSIAVPPLGCGNGGLEWRDVEPRILEAFARVPDVDVQLFAPPAGAPAAAEMATSTQRPTMTRGASRACRPGRSVHAAIIHGSGAHRVAEAHVLPADRGRTVAVELRRKPIRTLCGQSASRAECRGGTLSQRLWRRQRDGRGG